ncbi:hypothetical protein [Streptomyces melanosporofaciens]|uniref:DUF1579 domain-containing protein n=1 Tax=Streptomyces melanosporofaciens TaxID=67327 RepID=A0A1H4KBQ1_STRMJ|nr:hypothetical protein [Streptomyces melanosporofaciens]SEB55970.1 hypothetical protein SAMN04490356_0575 [Streptomyces melanosporofaciens]
MTTDSPLPADHGLMDALHATGPSGEHADKLMLFGQFVGSWDIDWSGTDRDGKPAQATGELHFGWILGGRAVQDTWIMPGRHELAAPSLRPFHGTTVRFYDPDLDAWRSTWIEPVNARVRRFVGRPVDGDIVLLSDEERPWLRWRFTDITPSSARWLGETSHDNGTTWACDEQMILTRRPQ